MPPGYLIVYGERKILCQHKSGVFEHTIPAVTVNGSQVEFLISTECYRDTLAPFLLIIVWTSY